MKTLGMLGCGGLAEIVAKAVGSELLAEYQMIGAYSRTRDKARGIAEIINATQPKLECVVCESLQELIALRPDYIIESAAPDAMRAVALPALREGISVITLSIGALADDGFREEVERTARDHGARVHIVSGAIGGFDVLRTASLMGDCKVSFHSDKGPNSLKGTAVYQDELQTEEKIVFTGNAAEAIAMFPTKVNVAVAASLATVGPRNIEVSMSSKPGFVGDTHHITLESDQVIAEVKIYSKTAEIAGWSVVNTLRNLASPIVFG